MEINEDCVWKPKASLSMSSSRHRYPNPGGCWTWPLIPASPQLTGMHWEGDFAPFPAPTPPCLIPSQTHTRKFHPLPSIHSRNVPLQIQIHKPESKNNNILMPLVAYSQSMVMFSFKQAIKLVSSWLDTNFLSQRSGVLGIMLMKNKSNPSSSQEADAI